MSACPLATTCEAAYLANAVDEVLVERYLERTIAGMIDINYPLLTESGQAPPPDSYTSFLRLAEIGVLDREFASRVAACAGLRNRIVHECNELDAANVFERCRRRSRTYRGISTTSTHSSAVYRPDRRAQGQTAVLS